MKFWQEFVMQSWRTGAAALLILFTMFFIEDKDLRIEIISIACIFGFAAADAVEKKNKK